MSWTVKFNTTELSGIRNVQISESLLFDDGIGVITPRRATFESYVNESEIYEHIRDGSNIIDKTISEYFVELYFNGVIKFTGYIDVSKCNYNKKEDSIIIFCYDYTELINVYSDKTTLRPYGGIDPLSSHNYFVFLLTLIGFELDITLSPQNNITRPVSNLPLDICTIPLHLYGNYSPIYTNSADQEDYGFYSPDAGKTVLYITWGIFSKYSNAYRYAFAKIYRLFPGHGFSEYTTWESGEPISDWIDYQAGWFTEINNILRTAGLYAFDPLAPSNFGYSQVFSSGNTEVVIHKTGSNTSVDYYFGQKCEIPFNGELLLSDDSLPEGISQISVIKDLLLINRATIIAKDDGIINIRNLEEELVTHIITTGILSFHTSIIDIPLDVQYNLLSGYCESTKTITEAIYDDLFGINQVLEITIDNLESHDIHVSDIITVYGVDYVVKSVKRLYKEDEYEIIGWAI